jgi:putative heme-binding domain-containing protein
MKLKRFALAAAAFLAVRTLIAAPVDPFLENIRPTDAQPAQDEAKSFHLPPGFEIQLVASEPLVGKPFNIAFDAKGRLWITVSKEYPFPAKTGKGPMDRIMILDDFDDQAHAGKVTTFAKDLNIPVGIYPYKDGCIAYSIPNISYYADTDGDGKADQVKQLVGPFGFDRDTHGMNNNFRRGFDGWVYACHGFNNVSHAKALDGSELNMESGNTYRFKVDGSHAEQYTWGQTNPFGMTPDALGNYYTADSHSKPIYQLIRGGYYEGIRKTDDGMGFAPLMMNHLHNSTAIASSFLYTADQWPQEYRGNTFNGNVVTSRINRDSLEYRGTSPWAKEEPDFLTTEDPWFRPNQLQMGPDGQMWVADFYNKIIGHYEVPLTNPLRDHTHGRIWRIVYKGTDGKAAPPPWHGDLTKSSVAELLETLKNPNLMLRMLATDQLSDRIGKDAIGPVKQMLASGSATETQKVHGLWVLFRLGAPLESELEKAAADPTQAVRVHAMHVLSELGPWSSAQDALAVKGTQDGDLFVRRAAADAMATHPQPNHIKPLLAIYDEAAKNDTHLRYQVKVALRQTLKATAEAYAAVASAGLSPEDAQTIAEVSLAVPTEASGKFLAGFIGNADNKAIGNTKMIAHAIRYAPAADAAALTAELRKQAAADIDLQLAVLRGILEADAQKGATPDATTGEWATDLAGKLLTVAGGNAKQTSDRQKAGAELAGLTKAASLAEPLKKIATGKGDAGARGAAAKAWAAIDPAAAAEPLSKIAANPKAPMALRHDCITATATHEASRHVLIEHMTKAQAGVQSYMAREMSNDPAGGTAVLDAVQAGKITPRVLQSLGIANRVRASEAPDVDRRIAELTKGLGSEDQEIQKLIDARKKGFNQQEKSASAERGLAVFTKNCTACHSIDGKGGVVGPQLDGVGNRGLDRLLEDVLDPNRAVDPAFHAWDIRLKDGTDLTGIPKREEGETAIFADTTGKEVVVPKNQIERKKESNLSLMPTNFGELIPEKDFYDLVAFLLSKNAKK